jgi:hypothetical protein
MIALKSNYILFKVTGKLKLFANIFKDKHIFLPPLIIKVNKTYVAIVIPFIYPDDYRTLWIKKIWINPNIISEEYTSSDKHPYFNYGIDILSIFLKSYKNTLKTYSIDNICYSISKTDEDQALKHILSFFNFHEDLPKTLENYTPVTSWRTREGLPFIIYTKAII